MNNTTANGNLTCSFSSISQVLYNTETGNLNITNTIQSCPNICTLAWGIGNPDLSGIGVRYTCLCIVEVLTNPYYVGEHLIHSPDNACCDLGPAFHYCSSPDGKR